MSEALRDRFFAAGTEAERAALVAEVAAIDAAPLTTVDGLPLSHFPTARCKRLRFVAAEKIDPAVRGLFARPCPELPALAAGFVDPELLAYHDFENIVGLDHLFEGTGEAKFKRREAFGRDVTRLDLAGPSPLTAALGRLDGLGLYAPPFGASRGGRRFIFHAAALAAALTAGLRKALPAEQRRGFVGVNPVFRCNRFDPGDAPFAMHVDSPYHDRSRRHVSRRTLLLYLTPGRGEGALEFADGRTFAAIEGLQVFLFDQALAHAGRAFADGPKVFVRSELVFEDAGLEHAPAVGAAFARACYLGRESVFQPELAAHADAAYDAAAAAHWGGASEGRGPVVRREFRGLRFVTDGYDYWFRRGSLTPVEAAALALLDLLGAHVGGEPFARLCRAQVVPRGEGAGWISRLLDAHAGPPEPVFTRIDKEALFPPLEETRSMDFPGSPDFEADPFPDDWDAPRNTRVREVHERARGWAMRRILAAPVVLLGKQVFLDPDRFVVEADRIHVLSRTRLGPVHFAGASFFGPEDFVGVDVTLDALQPLVPPIFFREDADALHLRCDLFRNTWMVSHQREKVPVPRVLERHEATADRPRWLNAAGLTLKQLGDEKDGA